jgi:hypothetical protein
MKVVIIREFEWPEVLRYHLGSQPAALGFVSFGAIRDLRVEAPILNFWQRCTQFQRLWQHVDRAEFDRIVTHADGASASRHASRRPPCVITACSWNLPDRVM